MKSSTTSNSQLWNCLKKQGRQWPSAPSYSRISDTHDSFDLAMANKAGKESFNEASPHHSSNQNLTLPFLTMKQTLLLKASHLSLIAFQKLTSYPSFSTPKHQPPFPKFLNYHPLSHKLAFRVKSPTPLAKQGIIESRKLLDAKPMSFLSHAYNRSVN